MSEVPDYMRGLGFFLSDYLIECLSHELQVEGKRKVSFEDLVKLYVNYSLLTGNGSWVDNLETSLKKLCCSTEDEAPEEISVNKKQLISVLTETAEKIEEKDAEMYLKEFFRNSNDVSLTDFMHQITKFRDGKFGCFE